MAFPFFFPPLTFAVVLPLCWSHYLTAKCYWVGWRMIWGKSEFRKRQLQKNCIYFTFYKLSLLQVFYISELLKQHHIPINVARYCYPLFICKVKAIQQLSQISSGSRFQTDSISLTSLFLLNHEHFESQCLVYLPPTISIYLLALLLIVS